MIGPAFRESWDFVAEHFGEWDAWVAIGTIALALATWRLARETRALSRFTQREVAAAEQQASAANEQLAVARESLQASTRPIALDVPEDPSALDETVLYEEGLSTRVNRTQVDVADADGYLNVSIPFRNVGAGVAFIDRCQMRTTEYEWEGASTVQALPPGEAARLRFSVPTRAASYAGFKEAVVDAGQIVAEISY